MEMIGYAALIFVLGNLIWGLILWLRVRKLYSYPGLLGFPVFGNLYYFYKTVLPGSLDSMVKYWTKVAEEHGKNGLCFHWSYGGHPTLIVSSPQVVKEIGLNSNLCDKAEYMYGSFSSVFQGVFGSYRADDLWKLKRKEYNIYLKKSYVDKDYNNTFIKSADKLIDLILASPSAVNVSYATVGVVQSSTVGTLFGNETSLVYEPQIIQVMQRLAHFSTYIMGNPKISGMCLFLIRKIGELVLKKGVQLQELLLEGCDRVLPSNIDNKEKSLSLKIASRYKKYNDSKDTLIKELQDLYFTSTHTATCALSNSIIFLALLPDIQERAWQEQFEIFANDNRDPTIDDINQMQFLNRYIKECLRFLSPPVFGKLATADININGITIPRGTGVIFLTKYMKMDPKYWKNPNVFDPDRFIEESETLKYTYLPFGLGVRNCPGMYFATVLMKTILSKILRRLKLRPVEKDFRFEDIQYKCSIMMEIENAPLLQVEERS